MSLQAIGERVLAIAAIVLISGMLLMMLAIVIGGTLDHCAKFDRQLISEAEQPHLCRWIGYYKK